MTQKPDWVLSKPCFVAHECDVTVAAASACVRSPFVAALHEAGILKSELQRHLHIASDTALESAAAQVVGKCVAVPVSPAVATTAAVAVTRRASGVEQPGKMCQKAPPFQVGPQPTIQESQTAPCGTLAVFRRCALSPFHARVQGPLLPPCLLPHSPV